MRPFPIRWRGVLPAVLITAVACSPKPGDRAETGQVDTTAQDTAAGATATAPARPNDEMQAVLTSLASLHPKPIVELSAVEARKQPAAW